MPINSIIPYHFCSYIARPLSDIAIFVLIAEIAFKHGRRPLVLSLLVLAISAGFLGSLASAMVGTYLKNNVVLLTGVLLLVYCGSLVLMPLLSHYIGLELEPGGGYPGNPGAAGGGAERETTGGSETKGDRSAALKGALAAVGGLTARESEIAACCSSGLTTKPSPGGSSSPSIPSRCMSGTSMKNAAFPAGRN